MQSYADLPMDLADASLVLLAEALNHGRVLSTDHRDFHAYRGLVAAKAGPTGGTGGMAPLPLS